LDIDAVRAVTRLIDKGFEAYLVGGCVRDLLLDRTPKDYDIATEARPPQVKRTFPRNCRIIGRRFKLAHLHFHGNTKILECSTFRRTPQERPDGEDADLLITRDNEFGTAEEDALRRDFTVNALFLDPTRDLIVDHVDGLKDIDARVIRTIGDPVVRFREDPVRILRAAKFAGRLGFTVEEETLAAMGETAEDLVRAAPPRVLEEILRLLRSGHARSSFELLRDVGAIKYLVPVVGSFLENADDEQTEGFWNLLGALDQRLQSHDGEPPPNGVLLAVLMYGAVNAERGQQPTRSASSIAESLLGSLATDLRLPRRDSGCLKRVCGVQHRFEQPEEKRRFRVESFVQSPYFEEALQLFALRTLAEGKDRDLVEQWYDTADSHSTSGAATAEAAPDQDEPLEDRPRKKRRRRRRRTAESDEAPTSDSIEAADDNAQEESEASETAGADDAEPRAAKKTKAKARKKATKKATKKASAKARDDKTSTKEEDLSDVTFPSDAEVASPTNPFPDRAADDRAADDRASDEADDPAQADDLPGDGNGDDEAQPRRTRPARRRRRRLSERDDEVHDDVADEATDQADELPSDEVEAAADEGEEEGGSKRRRRGRRGRGRSRSNQDRDGDAEAAQADAEGQEDRRGRKKVKGKKTGEQKRDGKKRNQRGDGRRDKKRGNRSKSGVKRDVDVVPRYRDRRGKVEVIEPVSLDLSAFDVELDPKRVPTFGSIVEGSGRTKRRGPRPPKQNQDSYRPPPPPGGKDRPDPPPPPVDDSPDTFGDW